LRLAFVLIFFYNSNIPAGETPMSGKGSSGNVIAALASFFIPGLGQLIQGRPFAALIFFVLSGIMWIFFLGWLIHLFSVLDAAWYKP